ncbi:MAG: GMC oxidoreductase [Chloroflexota bacterium]
MITDNQRAVVIGSGPTGATAAQMLLERGIPVTLLESGAAFQTGFIVRGFGRNLFRKWAIDHERYAYVASGDPDTEWLSALAPGGLSNYWTGAVPRFAPEDFYEGERLHERYRWPVSYAEVAPYYTYAEQLLGVVGERRAIPQVSAPVALVEERHLPAGWRVIAEQAERCGQGLAYTPMADGPNWTVRRAGAAFNSFEQLVSRLARYTHFELRLAAHAQRLTWNTALGRVDGVEYVDRATGTSHHIQADAVVVAAGPLASPKLLLQSVSTDFPAGLGNRHGLVGHFLHDHPKDWCVLELDRGLPRLDQPLYLSRAPYAHSPPLQGASMTIGPLSKVDRLLSLVGATTRRFGLVTFASMLPEADNYVGLHPEQRDQFGMPVLDIHMRYGKDAAQTVSASHAHLRTILDEAGYGYRLECPLQKMVPGASFHYAGAVRMHSSVEHGVLNGWNRLHDVDNVAVVDASCFTTAVEKNPTLTAMALAARAADRLAHDLKHGAVRRETRQTHALQSIR